MHEPAFASKLARAHLHEQIARAYLTSKLTRAHLHENTSASKLHEHFHEQTCTSALAQANSHKNTSASTLVRAYLQKQSCANILARAHLRKHTCPSQTRASILARKQLLRSHLRQKASAIISRVHILFSGAVGPSPPAKVTPFGGMACATLCVDWRG